MTIVSFFSVFIAFGVLRKASQASLRSVLILHGHENGAKQAVARFLTQLDLRPIILHEQPSLGRTIIEKFEDYSEVVLAIALLTKDDVVRSDGEPDQSYRARQNVVFELGYCIGKLGRNKVIALREEGVELPSDISGVIYVDYDSPGAWKLELAKEIRAAGIDIDVNKVL
jgi:predicted nucleotide-binding protein